MIHPGRAAVILAVIAMGAAGCTPGGRRASGGGGGGGGTGAEPSTGTDDGESTGTEDGTGEGSDPLPDPLPEPGVCATEGCPAGLLCDRWIGGLCVECRTTSDCAAAMICTDGSCAAARECASDLDCLGDQLLCDQEEGRCVACNSAADCPDGGCLGSSCVGASGCASSLECAEQHLLCAEALPPDWPEDFGGKACLECASDVDCQPRFACESGLCWPRCEKEHTVCSPTDGWYGMDSGECPTGAFCGSPGSACWYSLWEDVHEIRRSAGVIYGVTQGSGNHLFRHDLVEGGSTELVAPSHDGGEYKAFEDMTTNSNVILVETRYAAISVLQYATHTATELKTIAPLAPACDGLVADATYAACLGDSVRRFSLGTGDLVDMGVSFDVAWEIAWEGGVWGLSQGAGEMRRLDLETGETQAVSLPDGYENAYGMRLDDGHLFYVSETWAGWGESLLYRFHASDHSWESLGTADGVPIAFDGARVLLNEPQWGGEEGVRIRTLATGEQWQLTVSAASSTGVLIDDVAWLVLHNDSLTKLDFAQPDPVAGSGSGP